MRYLQHLIDKLVGDTVSSVENNKLIVQGDKKYNVVKLLEKLGIEKFFDIKKIKNSVDDLYDDGYGYFTKIPIIKPLPEDLLFALIVKYDIHVPENLHVGDWIQNCRVKEYFIHITKIGKKFIYFDEYDDKFNKEEVICRISVRTSAVSNVKL